MAAQGDERQHGYTGGSIALHWIVALGVLFMLTLGYIIVFTPGEEAGPLIWLHTSVGALVLIAAWFRVVWRTRRGLPPVTPEHKPWERKLARASHYTLLTLLFLIPLTGYLTANFLEEPIAFFGLFNIPKLFAHDQTLLTTFFTIHRWLAFILTGVLVLHLAGAFKGQFVNRDGTLSRMLSPKTEGR